MVAVFSVITDFLYTVNLVHIWGSSGEAIHRILVSDDIVSGQ